MQRLFKVIADAALRWKSFLLVLNWLFFCFIVIGVFLAYSGFVEIYAWPINGTAYPVELDNVLFTFGWIFLFNLVVSGFLFLTLTGLVFFALSVGFLLYRALVWGFLLNGLSTSMFLVAFPTLILEGEGYVLATLAGTILGLSWLKPKWVFREKELSRSEALKRVLKDCACIYFFAVVFLFVAAVIESVTLFFI